MSAEVLRRGDAAALEAALDAQRAQTLRLFDALRAALGEAMDVRYLEHINPPRWELAHLAWFEEFWLARNPQRQRGAAAQLEAPRAASLLPRADERFDSSRIAHTKRWQIDLPSPARAQAYAAQVRERTRTLLRESTNDDDALYFFRLALAHEAMHHEAGAMIAQTLALPVADALPQPAPLAAAAGEIAVPGAALALGADDGGFAFDNELGAHEVTVGDLRIDAAPVSWRTYLPFVEAGGYDDERHWSDEGWAWRQRVLGKSMPLHLARDEHGTWQRAAFGRWLPLDLDTPAMHLAAHEAEAWCRWVDRRLPTEPEWMLAARDERFAWGQVWEWTASPFAPFPGFAPHPYRDYSAPWFDGRPVLKGGSFASAPFMKHVHYRNFFRPERNDVFAGFRSVAV